MHSGDQHRSWHATSIQLVQPMPDTVVQSVQSTATRRLFSTAGEPTSATEGTSSSQCTHVQAQPSFDETTPVEKLHLLLSHKRRA